MWIFLIKETSNLWFIFQQAMWIFRSLYPLPIYIPRCGFTGASALTFEPNVPIQCSCWATWNRPLWNSLCWLVHRDPWNGFNYNPITTESHNPQYTAKNQGFMGFGHCSCWTTNYIMRLPCHHVCRGVTWKFSNDTFYLRGKHGKLFYGAMEKQPWFLGNLL